MPLTGHAFLALWNDIAPHRIDEYDQWHTLEHVPERVSVTGFHGARRYVNRGHRHHVYFTLYDVATLDVFSSDEYKDLLDNPTPASKSMRPDFSHFLRATCQVTSSRGTGIGGAIGCLCVPSSVDGSHLDHVLDDVHEMPRINAVHCGSRRDTPLAVPFGSGPAQTASVIDFDRVALIEGLDRAACGAALTYAKRALELPGLEDSCTSGAYDLAFLFPGSDPSERIVHRRPGWRPA